jgi:hypothetical protein
VQGRIEALLEHGFQERGDLEDQLGTQLGRLALARDG